MIDNSRRYAIYQMNEQNLPHRVMESTGEEVYKNYDPVTRNIRIPEKKIEERREDVIKVQEPKNKGLQNKISKINNNGGLKL